MVQLKSKMICLTVPPPPQKKKKKKKKNHLITADAPWHAAKFVIFKKLCATLSVATVFCTIRVYHKKINSDSRHVFFGGVGAGGLNVRQWHTIAKTKTKFRLKKMFVMLQERNRLWFKTERLCVVIVLER